MSRRQLASGREVIKRIPTWDAFKAKVATLSISLQYGETEKNYQLKAIEGRRVWVHTIWKSEYLADHNVVGIDPVQEAADQADFEAAYMQPSDGEPPTHETDSEGKVFVHQSSTPVGATTYFTSAADDPSDPHAVGGGSRLWMRHTVGEGDIPLDVHFNSATNRTWLHSGYAIWENSQWDCINLGVFAYGSTTQAGSNTLYNTLNSPGHPWHGKLILPAAGDGTLDVTALKLVGFYPSPDEAPSKPRYWNATWNSVTKQYDDITAAAAGDGEFNMFIEETELFRFINQIIVNGTNSAPWSFLTHDTQRIGDGMFLRLTPVTNIEDGGTTTEPPGLISDHDWSVGVTLIMHRERTL